MVTKRKAVVLTAFDRPGYFQDTLDSWLKVRGLKDWDFYISLDDSPMIEVMRVIAQQFQRDVGPSVTISINSPNLGVLKHPYVMIDSLVDSGYDYVLRTEDDLEVSNDILEYFTWAFEEFEDQPKVKTVHGHSKREFGDETVVRIATDFNPWVFGVWASKWQDLAINWDLDYSTYTGMPGHQAGFDWNFGSRVYPNNIWYGVYPEVSRVQNIGVWGVHGTPDNFPTTPTYQPAQEPLGGRFDIQF